MVGICAYGGYVPRYRLDRKLVFRAMGWMNPATIANSKGEKAVANFDEDSITMAVAAGLDALKGEDRTNVDGVYFASTSFPYKERLNAGIVTAALGVRDQVRAADFTGSSRAGTTALLSAIEGVSSGQADNMLVCASESRLGRPASASEMIYGDGAAAMIVGNKNVIAEFKGSFSTTYDFVDHFRGAMAKYDRQWEDRWIRDLGIGKLVPEAVQGLMDKYGLKGTDFTKIVFPCIYPPARKKLYKTMGFNPDADQNNLQMEMGDSGTAHALVMLSAALEEASPGDKILVISFGSGCDTMVFEVTNEIRNITNRTGVSGSLGKKVELDNYNKYLVWRDILPVEVGLRGEEDINTRFSMLWRKRKEVLGLWGCKCKKCGTAQYPPQKICVNPKCGVADQMESYLYSDKVGRIASFTADVLAPSVNPPAIYGQVEFDGGGKYLFDLTDCDMSEVKTGIAVSMSFRRNLKDDQRGISGYFWKAIPQKEEK
jgi:hydroxymethylglutaryl-CoA synthase